MAGITLESLAELEDALEVMRERSATREQYVEMHKPQYRARWADAWDQAEAVVRTHGGNVRKALNQIRKEIQEAA